MVEEQSQITELENSPAISDKPTVALLDERLRSAIAITKYFGIGFAAATCATAVYFLFTISGHGERLSKIDGQLGEISKKVDHLLDKQSKDTLRPSPAAKADPEDIKAAAVRATSRKITIPPEDIQLVAEPLLQNPTPVTWEAITQLLNLRSYVNSTLEEAKRHIVQTVRSGEWVKPRSSNEWAELIGGGVVLDGTPSDTDAVFDQNGKVLSVLGNIIFKDSRIVYRGGKVTLVNVFFDNCTFDVDDNTNGRKFARNVLDPAPLTKFSAD